MSVMVFIQLEDPEDQPLYLDAGQVSSVHVDEEDPEVTCVGLKNGCAVRVKQAPVDVMNRMAAASQVAHRNKDMPTSVSFIDEQGNLYDADPNQTPEN